jgi:hypothetical protein
MPFLLSLCRLGMEMAVSHIKTVENLHPKTSLPKKVYKKGEFGISEPFEGFI